MRRSRVSGRLDAHDVVACEPVFLKKISTRIMARPEFAEAMDFARTGLLTTHFCYR